jgi:hypothetical protein
MHYLFCHQVRVLFSRSIFKSHWRPRPDKDFHTKLHLSFTFLRQVPQVQYVPNKVVQDMFMYHSMFEKIIFC